MNIYSFKPTFLYIKIHTKTGLKYFGKTTKNPEKYIGSGIHWKNHIKKHGKEFVETLWYELFTDMELCKQYAINFSIENDIVNSNEWANLMIEDGMTGNGSPGRLFNLETKQKISKANSGKKYSKEINLKKGRKGKENSMYGVRRFGKESPHYGKKHSQETCNLLSDIFKESRKIKILCPHCNKSGDKQNMMRWHFDNCRKSDSYKEKITWGRVCRLCDKKEMDPGNWAIYIKSITRF